ncbi:MAG TPA: CsbD family protein [Mycobacterium sp.]|nr:CsbD family protein [Mycobacterium sp.]
MTAHDKADQARKGLIASVKGKAKELVGAVTGNDSLTTEGQLEQTQARERKDANSVEAVADAEAEQASAEAADARVQAAQKRVAVNVEAAAVEDSIRAQQEAQRRAAEQAGAQDAAKQKAQAELDAQREVEQAKVQESVDVRAAAIEVADAVDEHDSAEYIATNAHEEADRIRARAARLTNDADLP